MSKSKISSDATIEGVINTLDNPKEYVRGVLENMHRAKKELRSGDVRVRIGTTGRGISPHYLIEDMPCLTNEDWDDIMNPPPASDEGDDDEKYYFAYHGKNHGLLDLESMQLRGLNWSSKFTTFDEVKNLLGVLRGVRPAPPQ